MRKLCIIMLTLTLFLASCQREPEVITCYADEPTESETLLSETLTITDIVDATESGEIDCNDAEEVFYSDGEYSYIFECVKSQHITVHYSDGTSENVADALDSGRMGIEELDRFGIGYSKACYVPSSEDNVLEHEQALYCGNTVTTVSYEELGKDGISWSKSFAGSDSAAITDLLRFLDYRNEICKCSPEYTFETEWGTYGVNMSEGYARHEGKQVSLTQEQISEIGKIIDRNF